VSSTVKAIKNHEDDNVATIFGDVKSGDKIDVIDKAGTKANWSKKMTSLTGTRQPSAQ
jgi:hypothetical protein